VNHAILIWNCVMIKQIPRGNKNKFIGFYLNKHDKIDDYEMIMVYTSVGVLNSHNNQKLLFLLAHDDFERFNRFYEDFIESMAEKSIEEIPVDFYVPFSMTNRKS
jgi:hypothetical protein